MVRNKIKLWFDLNLKGDLKMNKLKEITMYLLVITILAGFTLAYSRYIEALEYSEKVEYLKEASEAHAGKNINNRVSIDGGRYTLELKINE